MGQVEGKGEKTGGKGIAEGRDRIRRGGTEGEGRRDGRKGGKEEKRNLAPTVICKSPAPMMCTVPKPMLCKKTILPLYHLLISASKLVLNIPHV